MKNENLLLGAAGIAATALFIKKKNSKSVSGVGSLRSPKNKYLAVINTSKPLGNLGSSFSLTSDNINELTSMVAKNYYQQAQKVGAKLYVTYFENKEKFPKFNWVQMEETVDILSL